MKAGIGIARCAGAVVVALVLPLLFAGIAWVMRDRLQNPTLFPPDDFIEYWAAGRLNLRADNPYDGDLLFEEQRPWNPYSNPIMMWNPPWTLSVAMPVGAMPVRIGQFLWLGINLTLLLACGRALFRHYGGPESQSWVPLVLVFTFLPTLFLIKAGQISAFILAGCTAFILAERYRRWLAAGSACVLAAVKPHLVFLIWPAMAVWVLRRPHVSAGRSLVIVGGVVTTVAALAAPLAFNSACFTQYLDALRNRPPDIWKSPTIGTLLRELIDPDFRLQFVAPVFGLIWLVVIAVRTRSVEWDWSVWAPRLILVSFITAPYGAWPYDLVILFPAVFQIAGRIAAIADPRRSRIAVGCWIIVNLGMLGTNATGAGAEWFVWVAPTIGMMYYGLHRMTAERHT